MALALSLAPAGQQDLEILRDAGALVIDEGVRKARVLAEGLEVRRCQERGWASAVLLKASRDAGLIVLGLRGHSGFDGLAVGSTAVQVASHADRPVVVVRSARQPARGDGVRVVVGVDGSPASESALGFAFEEAALRDGSVTAVCSWWDPATLPGPDRVPFIDPKILKLEAITRFEQAVAPWRSDRPKVPVETRFVVETPRRALVNAADDAVLLVVGDRGIGSVPQTLLGPVTQAALQEAPCPVAVVPARQAKWRKAGGDQEAPGEAKRTGEGL